MKTHILTTNDGLEFRLEEEMAHEFISKIEKKEVIVINDNVIQPWDAKIRRLPRPAPNLLQLAEGLFSQKTPRFNYLLFFVNEGSSALRKEGKIVSSGLVEFVGSQVAWDTQQAMDFIRKDWDALQEKNDTKPRPRLDRNEYAEFEPSNSEGIYCGKCLNGWKPGNSGLKPCSCNLRVLTANSN